MRIDYSLERLQQLPVKPVRKMRRSNCYCVKRSSGRVTAVFSSAVRVVLVTSTARAHGNRGVRPGSSARVLRGAYSRRRPVGRGLFRANGHSPRLIGVRNGRVRFVAVAHRSLLRNRRALVRHLRLAGV